MISRLASRTAIEHAPASASTTQSPAQHHRIRSSTSFRRRRSKATTSTTGTSRTTASNLLRAYDTRTNIFGIQQANVIVESAPEVEAGRRFGARVDLQFGQATETVQGGAANEPRPDVYRHIWQAYGT